MERCLLAGVPVWWRPGDRPGLRASLLFRAGRLDETLLTAGRLSALVAWALLPTFPASVSVNGSVGGVISHIELYGPPDAVASTLSAVAARLHGPTDADWADSRDAILRMVPDEEDLDAVLIERFGVYGPGAGSYRRAALQALTAAGLREVGTAFFSAGNGALALDGDVPARLDHLPLPPGLRVPALPLPPMRPPVPRVYVTPDKLVLSGLVPTSDASGLAQRILRTRLEERLRHRLRSTYAVECTSVDLGVTTLAVFSADVSAERVAEASEIVAETAWLLSAVPAEERELKDHAFAAVQAFRAPEAEAAEPFRAAYRELLGKVPRTVGQRIASIQSLGLADLRTPLASLFGSAMLGAPTDRPLGLVWPSGTALQEGQLQGRRHLPRRGAEHHFEPYADIVVADARLQRGGASGRLSFDATRAHVLAWPDGRRTLIGDDGLSLTIEPTLWRDGQQLVAAVDHWADPRLTLTMPPREPASVPAPLPFGQRQKLAASQGAPMNRWVKFGLGFVAVLLFLVSGNLAARSLYPSTARTVPVATAAAPVTAAASPSGSGRPAVAVHRYRFSSVAFNLPDSWRVLEQGVELYANGPLAEGENIQINSIDGTTAIDAAALLRSRNACPKAHALPDVVIDGNSADVVDCAANGQPYRVIIWQIGQRLTEIVYWAPHSADSSTALKVFLESLTVHPEAAPRPPMAGTAATGPQVTALGFVVAAPAGWTKVKSRDDAAVEAAGFPPPLGDDYVAGVFKNANGDTLLVTFQGGIYTPYFFASDRRDAANDANHVTSRMRAVDVGERLSYLFDDEGTDGRTGYVLVIPLDHAVVTIAIQSEDADRAWKDLRAVAGSLS